MKLILKYWYLPLFAIGAVAIWVISSVAGKSRRISAIKLLETEIKAVDAKAAAKKLEVDLGTARATQRVLGKYHSEIERLDNEKQNKIKKLAEETSPSDLAAYVVRIISDL